MFLPAGFQTGVERLIQYTTRYSFSLSRLVNVSEKGQVVYQAEKGARLVCFPELALVSYSTHKDVLKSAEETPRRTTNKLATLAKRLAVLTCPPSGSSVQAIVCSL